MKRAIFFAVLFLFSTYWPIYGQGNIAVLVEGTALRGSPRFLRDNAALSQTTPSQSVFPGVEVRFNQNGRITIGAGYQYWKLDGSPDTYLLDFCPKDKYCALPGSPYPSTGEFITRHPQTGEPLASVTKNDWAKANLVSSTAYLNILMKGNIRPFVAFGGGMVLIKQTVSTTSFVHPNIEEVIGHEFKFEKPENSSSENRTKPTIKGLAGVNIFPVAHTVASFSGGYHNGAVLNFSFGFVF